MQQLSGMDALFLRFERGNTHLHIGPVMVYEPPAGRRRKVGFAEVAREFERRVHCSPVFRRKLAELPAHLDRPYWIEDPDFRVREHLHRSRLARPGNLRQLCEEVARIHSRPLDRNRPLWEAHVIEGLDDCEGLPKGCFALYLKSHHATQDGAAGVQIVQALHEGDPRVTDAAPAEGMQYAEVLRRGVLNGVRRPLGLLRAARLAVPALRSLAGAEGEAAPRALLLAERTRFNAPISAERVVGFAQTRIPALSRVREAVPAATLNDVCLAVVSGAFLRYLASKGESPRDSLVAGFPINARAPGEKASAGNLLSASRVSLCSDVADPLARLEGISRETAAAKAAQDANVRELVAVLTDSLPDMLVEAAAAAVSATGLLGRIDMPFHTMVTNVPGSRVPLTLCGARMRLIAGLGPCMDGLGLFHTVSSYCETLTIGFQACARLMPDPAFYESCLRDSLHELVAAADARARASARGRRRGLR